MSGTKTKAKKEKFSFVNPDGSIKICKVIERLPDGTRIFEGGWKALPSVGTLPDGTEKRLIDMTPEEYENWNERFLKNFAEGLQEGMNRRIMDMR